jgi:hypothetical protein
MPSGAGNTTSSPVLPMANTESTVTSLFNYDTDRDAGPGLLIAKDSAGPGGIDSSKVQVFRASFTTVATIDTNARVELYVASKDFNSNDITVAIRLDKCSAAGVCTTIGSATKAVNNASSFKKVDLNVGAVDVTLQVGERLELRIAALADSQDDMWLAFGTRDEHSQIHLH